MGHRRSAGQDPGGLPCVQRPDAPARRPSPRTARSTAAHSRRGHDRPRGTPPEHPARPMLRIRHHLERSAQHGLEAGARNGHRPLRPSKPRATTFRRRNSRSERPSAAQVHVRYIPGRPKVNYRVYSSPGEARSPDVRASGSGDPVTIYSTIPGARTCLACSHASRAYYEAYPPLGHVTAAMVAPCLLGCRGTI
jgi:hypothetical protein